MLRRYRFALRPGWLVLHLVCAALITTMVLLGRWQLTVSEQKHFSLQNFGYALQWWLFSAFVALMWGRALRDHRRQGEAPEAHAEPEAAPPAHYRRYVMPQLSSTPVEPADETHAAYNDYLARLNEQDAEKETR